MLLRLNGGDHPINAVVQAFKDWWLQCCSASTAEITEWVPSNGGPALAQLQCCSASTAEITGGREIASTVRQMAAMLLRLNGGDHVQAVEGQFGGLSKLQCCSASTAEITC